jgi:hypothetical protein
MKHIKTFESYVQSLFEAEKTLVKNKESGTVYLVKNVNPKVHTRPTVEDVKKAREEDKEAETGDADFKKISQRYKDEEKKQTEKIDVILKDSDENTKKRGKILSDNWNKFVNAESEEDRVNAVREMSDNNLIEAHSGGKKIYLSSITGLPYKLLTKGDGSTVSRMMNDIIKKHGIDVPTRLGSKDRELADMSGKHNEAGVVAYLFDDEKNRDAYKKNQERLKELGGDEERFDKINKESSEVIKNALPKGAKITGALQVGGAGSTTLKDMGINPKVDPTDLIVNYTDSDGNKKIMKVSAKTYTDPRNITMKNSGTENAGFDYLGEGGKAIDTKFAELKKKYNWDDTTPEAEKSELKKKLKEEYLTAYSDEMVKLTKSSEGQQQLIKMWKSVHGCGKDVYTQIINKTTGQVTLHKPDHYCDPKPPFKVDYDGVKVSIALEGKANKSLNIVLKTEDKGSPKLLFKHISK